MGAEQQVRQAGAEAPVAASPTRAGRGADRMQMLSERTGVGARVGVNRTGDAVISATGPITAAMWRSPGTEILGHLTQRAPEGAHDGDGDDHRCGAASLLGGAIMRGQEATARFLENVAQNTPPHSPYGATSAAETTAIAGRVRAGTATFEDLNRAQELVYRSSRRSIFVSAQNPNGMSDSGVAAVARAGNGGTGVSTPAQVNDLLDSLEHMQPGQSRTVRILGARGATGASNHFVTIGRQADGRPYYYNPDPSRGDATSVVGRTPRGPHDTGVTPDLRAELLRLVDQQRMPEDQIAPDGTPTYPRATQVQ